jgi:putative transposase
MANRLHRYYGAGYLHFITTSCYRRRALLNNRQNRDLFLQVLEQVRRRYHFVVVGYVVMPEHVHLLFGEPDRGNPSVVMQAIKQGFARRLLRKLRSHADPRQGHLWSAAIEAGHIWQRRFYDFVVFSEKKRIEKLRYMHCNPGPPASPVLACWGGSRCSADWCSNQDSGRGAASDTMPTESAAPCW